MINDFDNHWIPSQGYKYLSNGTAWTDSIYLGRRDRIDNWHDTNEEPPKQEENLQEEETP